MVAARGFEHDERGLCSLEPGGEGRNPWLIVRHRPAFASGPRGDIKLRFSNIYTNKDLKADMILLTGPTLQDAGSVAPDNVRALGGRDAATHALGLGDPGYIGLSRPHTG